MRFKNPAILAAMMSLGIASSAFAQGPSSHPNQLLGSEDRLGRAPKGESGMTDGSRNNSGGNLGG